MNGDRASPMHGDHATPIDGDHACDAGDDEPGFGLYVHWPFCRAKCPYCDFNSHVAPAVDHDRWRDALLRELGHFAGLAGRRRLASVFFGGGTPSLMEPATVAALLDAAAAHFDVAPDVEVTLEANPTSVEAGRLAAFRTAGVSRVSLGIQALDDGALRFLGREHSGAEALRALEIAASLFQRYSFDLIYARPGQTPDAWSRELDQALDHAGGHLSVYQLTIEPGTRFHVLHERGDLVLPDDDLQADLFEHTRARLAQAGLPAYEISNHARPGEACRHNLTYWRYGEYLGIGPGAHGRLVVEGQRRATRTAAMPRAWLERVTRAGHAEEPAIALSANDQLSEMLIMGLRLSAGIPLPRIEAVCGRPFADLFEADALAELVETGLLLPVRDRLQASPEGTLQLNGVLSRLLDAVRQDRGTSAAATNPPLGACFPEPNSQPG